MVNILVTGSEGQLGSEIKKLSVSYKYNFFFTTKKDLDISDFKITKNFIDNNLINIIINCAAYTAVDKAENNEKQANIINNKSIENLAIISKEKKIKLIHISTDYVFDGKNYKPYKETDETNSNSVYGKTKLNGEKAIIKTNPLNSVIIRTSWLYSSYGNNFVKTILRLSEEKKELNIVFDQVGTPTYARDLAKVILNILLKIKNNKVELYHYSNEGALSWYDFAKEIINITKLNCNINPIESKEYPTLAKRPHYSLLNKSKIKYDFNISIPYWKDSLDVCLRELREKI